MLFYTKNREKSSRAGSQVFCAKLLSKQKLAPGICQFSFTKPADFVFTAGQFVQWRVLARDADVMRAYSICSAPADEVLTFCLKILPDGRASQMAADMRAGDELFFTAPRGRFVVSDDTAPLLFIAAGVGIAPIMSILRDELEHKQSSRQMRLIFGVRSEQDVFWTDTLDALQAANENFTYTLTLSRPTDIWSGKRGRVTEHLAQMPADTQYYVCGGADMVRDAREILIQNGAEPSAVHFEIF